MKAVRIVVALFCIETLFVAIICPRIPPLVGYLFCRLGHDLKTFGDPCQLQDELSIQNIVSFRFMEMKNVFRIVSGFICFVIYIPGLYGAHLMTSYEILPSLVFQKNCLAQFQAEVGYAKFGDHKKILGKYRQLQLLNIQFNQIYSRGYFAMVMSSVIAAVVTTGYFIVTSYHINQIIFILGGFPLITEYAIMFTIFTMASKVWNTSVEFRYAWKKNMRMSSRPLTRRYQASLQCLKIKIGSSNFVEQNTPFVFVSFLLEQTVSLLLMNNV
jgi:hypothetical protein